MTRLFHWYQTFDLVTLTVTFDLYSKKKPTKKLNLGHNIWNTAYRVFISYVYSLWSDLPNDSNIFDLVTLTVTFDLYLENLNFDHNF